MALVAFPRSPFSLARLTRRPPHDEPREEKATPETAAARRSHEPTRRARRVHARLRGAIRSIATKGAYPESRHRRNRSFGWLISWAKGGAESDIQPDARSGPFEPVGAAA